MKPNPRPTIKKESAPKPTPIPEWLLGLLLPCLVIAAYLPALHCSFIWDDDSYVTQNLALRSLTGLRQIWFSPAVTPQYYPLVHSSFWLEYHLWGLAPLGFHLVNVLLHGLAAWLLYLTLARLRVPGAWVAAAIFALHPVQVESVAWVTERKNVLSAVFYFASALAYLHFSPMEETEKSVKTRWKWYWLALVFFIAALLSKTVACSLPAALLLACWWKRGKVQWADVWRLIPFFVAGLCLGLMTAWTEKNRVGAEGSAWALTFAQRVLIAGHALWFYAEKLIWPASLTFVYPRWVIDTAKWWQWLFPATAAGVVAALWAMRTRLGRGPLVAVLFFAGTLGPALGFINVYPMRFSFVADHFQYLAAIGLIILFAAWAVRWPKWTVPLLLAVLGVLTWRQIAMYRDPETLWRATLDRNPDALLADNGLGVILLGQGQIDEAAAHFRKVLAAQPDYTEAIFNWGLVLFQSGQIDEAEGQFKRALELEPKYNLAHNGLGCVLLRQGQIDEAMAHFQKALDVNPADIQARLNLALALEQKGRIGDAVAQFQDCLVVDPASVPAHANLGAIFVKQGRVDDGIAHYKTALEIQPGNPSLLNDLAWIRAANPNSQYRSGAEAVRLAERACHLTDYRQPVMLNTLGAAYAEAGRFDDAIVAAEKARQAVLATGQANAADQVLSLIQLYKSRQPYHEPAPP